MKFGRAAGAGFLVIILCQGACSDSATEGGSVVMTTGPRKTLNLKSPERGRLRLPDDEPFNITVFKSSQTGQGRGASTGAAAGCTCEVDSGAAGTADADFQLGLAFDPAVNKPMDAMIRVRLRHELQVNRVPGAAPDGGAASQPAADDEPAGHVSLSIVLKESNGVTLHREDILSPRAVEGLRSSASSHDCSFDVRLEPGLGYYLYLTGHVDARSTPRERAQLRLEVTETSMEIQWEPAAGARGPAGDEPHLARGGRLHPEPPR